MNTDTGPVLGNGTYCGDGEYLGMFAANLLNKLSSKYWDNVQRLRNGAEHNFDDDSYYDTT